MDLLDIWFRRFINNFHASNYVQIIFVFKSPAALEEKRDHFFSGQGDFNGSVIALIFFDPRQSPSSPLQIRYTSPVQFDFSFQFLVMIDIVVYELIGIIDIA